MTDQAVPVRRKRTAVLVVHGIGSQRAEETVRGVVNAVWRDRDGSGKSDRGVWTHPERGPVDIDLAVMTTNGIPGSADGRSADFHELYWAHLMSETKAVAVLLWLFELGRKGPHFKPGMNSIWWCGAIFLCLLLLSIAVLCVQAIVMFSSLMDVPQSLVTAPYLMAFIAVLAAYCVALYHGRSRIIRLLFTILIGLCVPPVCFEIFAVVMRALNFQSAEITASIMFATWWLTSALLPAFIAGVASWLLMRSWGLLAYACAVGLSLAFFSIYIVAVALGLWTRDGSVAHILHTANLPWSMASHWSSAAAWIIIAIYLAFNAAFLQPYLGDAARYIRNSPANVAVRREIRRQAVDTLHMLHTWGSYDRIVVVAHSLGAIVAYDMLRTYYSRICDRLPTDPTIVGQEFEDVDRGMPDRAGLRSKARTIIRNMAKTMPNDPREVNRDGGPAVWLVTDFVTLGSPLAHAQYLLCNGCSAEALAIDFNRRIAERDLPTCPPQSLDGDGWLSFLNPKTKWRRCHHGGVFALTRWTCLYFPLQQIFWGDAIGGPSAPVFGGHILDWPVSTRPDGGAEFFTHTRYWDTRNGRDAPHIKALHDAIDLADAGVCNR
jgi:hypothetical protein